MVVKEIKREGKPKGIKKISGESKGVKRSQDGSRGVKGGRSKGVKGS